MEGYITQHDNDLTQVDNSTSYCDKSISFYDNNKCMNEPVERHVEKVEKRMAKNLWKIKNTSKFIDKRYGQSPNKCYNR